MKGPFRTDVIDGEAIRIGERELVPRVRVTRRVQRRALVGEGKVRGQGWGFVHMRPVAVIEREGPDERRVPIHNATTRKLVGMLVAALAAPLIARLTIAGWQAFKRQR